MLHDIKYIKLYKIFQKEYTTRLFARSISKKINLNLHNGE